MIYPSDREARVAFNDLSFKLGYFAFSPKTGSIFDPVIQRATIGMLAALQWTRDADEFGFELS